MKSIRRHLLSWLLPGFILLWIGTGVTIFLSIRQGWERHQESELREIAGVIPFGSGAKTDNLLLSLNDIAEGDIGIYFQIWGPNGTRFLKSKSLGQFELTPPEEFVRKGVFGNQVLGSGDSVRTIALVVNDSGGFGKVNIVVAKSNEELKASKFRLIAVILGVGLFGAAIFISLLGFAVNSGLKPLMQVGYQVNRIDAESMEARFSMEEDMPSELNPIVAGLNGLMARLEQSFSRERHFNADLAHELRNPVAALKSIAEVALKWPEQATNEDYEDIKVIATELQFTIENMLTLARLEKRETKLEQKPVKVRELVNDCWVLFAPAALERGVTAEIDISEDEVLETDPKLIRIIISNLLSNAADYTPDGSVIRICGQSGTGDFSISNPAPHLEKSDLPLLFNRLWRHDKVRTGSSHSGLGLSLARACAEALSLHLDAHLDDQSSISFELVKKMESSSSFAQVG